MKRMLSIIGICLMALSVALTGCSITDAGAEKIKDLEFTVVELEDIPSELLTMIDENKKGEMKMTYKSEQYLYMIRGYGEQKTGGYSIAIGECYLAKDGIHVKSSLLGPPHDKKILQEPSYPFAVVKVELMEKSVIFE